MLRKPENGWTTFELSKNKYSLSYLTDVSMDWLNAAINGLKNYRPFSVDGYLEPDRMICTVSFWNIHIFTDFDENEAMNVEDYNYETIHINMIEFCEKLYNDVNNNLQEWINWFCDDEIDLKEREKELKKKLSELRLLIDEKKDDFKGGIFFL